MEPNSRSLRSSKESQSNDDEKFNFDIDEYEINPQKILKIINRGYPSGGATAARNINGVEEKRKLIKSMVLHVQRNNIDDKVMQYDMLPDDLYLSYHKKMMRHEARMLESDVIQGENEADKLSLWSDKLDLAQWQAQLKQLTVIRNPEDEEEMEKKRILTKQTIDSMLAKYKAMKKHRSIILKNNRAGKVDPLKQWSQIYDRINRKLVLDYHSSSDEEEESMDVEQIRIRRKRKREQQCGGSIVILLTMSALSHHTKYAIIAEPLRRPYVIKISKQERNQWNKLMENAPKKFTNLSEFSNQVALPKRKVPIPLTINTEEPTSTEILRHDSKESSASVVGNKKRSLHPVQVEVRTLPVRHVKRR